MDLHGRIMNIQVDEEELTRATHGEFQNHHNVTVFSILEAVYRRGHRDARHAAAELVEDLTICAIYPVMTFEEWRKSTLPTWTEPGDPIEWQRKAFEAGQASRVEKEPEYLTADQLTEPGYYWWLPECFKNEPNEPEHWSVRNWHPEDSTRPRSGLFVGPLKAPVKRK